MASRERGLSEPARRTVTDPLGRDQDPFADFRRVMLLEPEQRFRYRHSLGKTSPLLPGPRGGCPARLPRCAAAGSGSRPGALPRRPHHHQLAAASGYREADELDGVLTGPELRRHRGGAPTCWPTWRLRGPRRCSCTDSAASTRANSSTACRFGSPSREVRWGTRSSASGSSPPEPGDLGPRRTPGSTPPQLAAADRRAGLGNLRRLLPGTGEYLHGDPGVARLPGAVGGVGRPAHQRLPLRLRGRAAGERLPGRPPQSTTPGGRRHADIRSPEPAVRSARRGVAAICRLDP